MASSSSSFKFRARSSLSDDILIEIFSFLPLNSIYKFKCLSKVWLSNLSNPNFITKWFQINNKSLPWIQYHSINNYGYGEVLLRFRNACHESHSEFMSRNQHLFSFKFITNEKANLCLLGSSKGLVLCRSLDSDGQRNIYHVCNPLTQKWVTLPSPPYLEATSLDVSGIFCDCSPLFTCCYKVVHIPAFGEPSKIFYVNVFCSNLGVWETFEVSCDEYVVWMPSKYDNVVILDGVLYWIEGGDRMLVYNLNQNNGSDGDRCCLINFPEVEFEFFNFDRRIGVSEGRICYTKNRFKGSQGIMSVWVLDKVNWQILHNDISMDNILAELRSWTGPVERIRALCVSPVDHNVVLFGWHHCVLGFNIQTRSIEKLCLGNRHVFDGGEVSLPFVLKPMPTVLPPPSWIDT